MAMQVTNNTPSTGYISWTGVSIQYKGSTYVVANGNTNLSYVYWKYADPLSFYGSTAFPTLGDDDLLVFVNKLGTALTVPNTTILDGSLIVPQSITANAIAANTITGQQILAGTISASEIAAGAIGANQIAANAVIAGKIAADAVTSAEIAANAITATELAANSVIAGKIAANAVSATTVAANAIGANHIAAGVITADKMAIGDFTNLAMYNEISNKANYAVATINSLVYFKIGTSAYATINFASAKSVEFKVNDEFLFSAYGYKEAGVTGVNAIIRYYYSDASWSNAGSAVLTLGAADALASQTVKVTAAPTLGKTVSNVTFFLEKDAGTAGYYYLRNLELRRKSAGNLIVDGVITASKIAVDAVDATHINVTNLAALSANLGDITAGSIKGVTIEGSLFKTPDYSGGGDTGVMTLDNSGLDFNVTYATGDPQYPTGSRASVVDSTGITIERDVGGISHSSLILNSDGIRYDGYGNDMNGGYFITTNASGSTEFYNSFGLDIEAPDATISLLANSVNSSTLNVSGKQTVTFGGQTLDLKAGYSQDHVYMAFYADSQNQNARSGYLGYSSSGNPHLTIANEVANGDINLLPNGTGSVISTTGYKNVGKKVAYSWNGTIATSSSVTLTHNLGYYPIVVLAGNVGNIILRYEFPTINSIRVYCYSSGNNSWTGSVHLY